MNRTSRGLRRPPQLCRAPRLWPLSLAKGATPINAAAWRRLRLPSSGIQHRSAAAVTAPTPGYEVRIPNCSACSGVGGDHLRDRGLQPGNLLVEMGNRGLGDGLALLHLARHLLQHGPHIDMLGAHHQKIPEPVDEGLLRGHRLKIVERSPELGQHQRIDPVGLGQKACPSAKRRARNGLTRTTSKPRS